MKEGRFPSAQFGSAQRRRLETADPFRPGGRQAERRRAVALKRRVGRSSRQDVGFDDGDAGGACGAADLHGPGTGEERDDQLRLDNPVVTLSFCMPETVKPAKERTYQVNAVYRQQLELYLAEDEDDSEPMMEAQDA